MLPAATFAAGPPAGARLADAEDHGRIHGMAVPFATQPVQGFSAVIAGEGGAFLGLVDNGFGAIENSADFLLRVYTLRLDPRTAAGGRGTVEVASFIELRDPERKIEFPIVQHFSGERRLTGADFDLESMQRAPDGTLWFGDEFGPFLVHTSADGVVLEAPIELPDPARPGRALRAPQSPYHEEGAVLRVMNALRWRGEQRGATRPPVLSPHHVLLVDGEARSEGRPIVDVRSLRAAGFPVVVWTVNDAERIRAVLRLGVDGVISDRPDVLRAVAREFDGVAGFDAQGHRGARDLRPENTLPAMEAALDNLVTTLETDVGVTRDGVAVLSHDPYLEPARCRRRDGAAYEDAALIRERTIAEIQAQFVCDGLTRGAAQQNDPELSPASVVFADGEGLADVYTPITLRQLFRFVDAYVAHYREGLGAAHPEAALRAANAARVRFNVEAKINPRRDRDARGRVLAERTAAPAPFVDSMLAAITDAGLAARVDVQSFDLRALLRVQDVAPAVRVVLLVGDFPAPAGDGANLQGEGDGATPWLAGLRWPYRVTAATEPFAVQASGGFEGMALRATPPALLPMLEKPLVGDPAGGLLIHEFDLATRAFTGVRWRYPLDPRAAAIGDFQLDVDGRGLVIERDDGEGERARYKAVRAFMLGESGAAVDRALVVDLLDIADPHGLAPARAGDLGVGGGRLALPFFTIEGLAVLPDDRLLIVNDNNLPFSVGRHVGDGLPDDSEWVVVQRPRRAAG